MYRLLYKNLEIADDMNIKEIIELFLIISNHFIFYISLLYLNLRSLFLQNQNINIYIHSLSNNVTFVLKVMMLKNVLWEIYYIVWICCVDVLL